MSAITGGRRGEIISLRWRDIDLDDGLVCLDENYVVRDGKREFKGTKTDEDRWMSLDSFSVALLSALKARRIAALAQAGLKLKNDAHIFSPEPDGSAPWNPDTYTHRYERLAAKVGVTKPLKNLRHFNATELLRGGVDVATVADRLGHADGGVTTLRFYASGTRTADQSAAEQLSRSLQQHRNGGEASAEETAPPAGKADRRRKRRVLMTGKATPAMRVTYFTEADLETHALAAGYNYAFRKSGMDVLVRVTLADLGLIRDALPVVEEFVRGITVNFGVNAA